MNEFVAYAVAAYSLLAAGFAGYLMLRDRPVNDALFYVVSVLEIAVVAMLVGGSVSLGGAGRDVDGVLFVSYLVTLVIVPPAAILWGIAEKTRWGTGVVVVAMLSVAVLCIRVLGIWQGRYV